MSFLQVQPHVYGITVPLDRQGGPEPPDRSTSWVEFAQPCAQSPLANCGVSLNTKHELVSGPEF